MTKYSTKIAGLLLGVSLLVFSCKTEPGPWQKFMACANNACVAEVVAVKDDFLKDPKPLFEAFIRTDERGEDHFVGWLYILRDSVLLNGDYASVEERFNLQQAVIAKAKEFENDPKYGTWSKSIIGELELLAIASELEDDLPITGTYTYELPNEAGSGELKILAADESTVRFALMVVEPPAHNQGMMEGTAPFADGVATISTSEYGGKCTISLTFSEGQLAAKTLEGGSPECGFGNNVRADGTYKMMDDLNPFAAEGGDETPAAILGHWVSTQDVKSELKIEGGKYIELYEGKEISNLPMSYHLVCPQGCNPEAETPCIKVTGQDDVCYIVVKAGGKSLEISMIGGRGNTLAFKKK